MLFTDNIVIINETKKRINRKLKQWRCTLGAKDFRVSRAKTQYLVCRFNKEEGGIENEVNIGGMAISRVEKFSL